MMINQLSVLQRIVEHENIHPQFRAARRELDRIILARYERARKAVA